MDIIKSNLISQALANVINRAIYTGENKTRLM